MVADEPFGPQIGVALPQTPTALSTVPKPYFLECKPLPPSHVLSRIELLRKSLADFTRASYTSAYEQFRYAYPAASARDPESLNQTIEDYIEEEYEDSPPHSSPQKIRNLLAMIEIAAPTTKGKLLIYARLVKSGAKNRTPSPSAPWTQQIASAFSFHLFHTKQIIAGTAIILQFAALLRPSELFSLT